MTTMAIALDRNWFMALDLWRRFKERHRC